LDSPANFFKAKDIQLLVSANKLVREYLQSRKAEESMKDQGLNSKGQIMKRLLAVIEKLRIAKDFHLQQNIRNL